MPPDSRASLLIAIMSIRAEHAGRIYCGDKQFEFRRQRPRFVVGTKIFVYEPTPVRAVTGYFFTGVLADIGHSVDSFEMDPDERLAIEAYLTGARRPTAIEISKPARPGRPLPLGSFGVKTAPQSYMFLNLR